MDRSASGHPSRERLRDFLHGTLDQALSEQVEEHILNCAVCCDTLSELHSVADPWLQPLGRPGQSLTAGSQPAPAGAPAWADPDSSGEQAAETWIGPYRLVRLLGEGGMGRVYLAQQERPVRRSVALKLIKAGLANRQLVARFEAERQALALMEHPNIPHVLDVGITPDGRHYFVTELISGPPITEYCQVHRLTVRQRLALFLPVCQAVQHAHHKAVVHRDIKPSNVLVCQLDGQAIPKVIDFGIAKALEDPAEQGPDRREAQTRYGQIVGTLEYMSPEQAALNRDDVDTRSDVYALGVLLYELLTDTTPLPRERAQSQPLDETLRAIREEEAERPSVRSQSQPVPSGGEAGLPPDALALPRSHWHDLDAMVLKALEKDRTRRYSTAAELADDIRRFLAHEPIRARRATAWGRLRRWTRRNPRVAALLALVALLTSLSAGVFLVLTLRLSVELARAENAERSASAARLQTLDQLWRSYVDQVRAARLSQQAGQQVHSLSLLGQASEIVRSLPQSGHLDAEGIRVLRNEAIACLTLTDLRLNRQWKIDTPPNLTQAFDARDERYAYVDARGDVVVRAMLDNQILATFTPDQPVEVLRLDDSGQTLGGMSYLSSRNKCYLWDLGRRELQAELPHEATDLSLAFSGDGRYLAAGLWNGQIRLYRRPDLSLTRSLFATPWPHQIAFAPGGGRVAISCATDHLVRLVGVDEPYPLTTLEHPAGVHGIAWNRAGSWLAAGCDDSRIYLWDVQAGKVHSVLEGHEAGGIHVSFDPLDQLLASHALDGTTRLWDCQTGQELVRARTSGVYQWSADGQYLLGGTTEYAERWEVVRGASRRTLHHGPPGNQRRRSSVTGPWSVEFDPTGQLLVSADYDGVRLWSVADGRQLAHLPLGPHATAAFHPAGDLLTADQGQLVRWPLAFERDEQSPSSDAARPESVPVVPATQTARPANHGRLVSNGRLVIGPPQTTRFSLGSPFPSGPVAHDQAGKTMAWASRADDRVLVWRAEISGEPRPFELPCPQCLALSPDGRWLAAGSGREAKIRVWDLDTGTLIHEFAEAGGVAVGSLAFDRSGHRLIAGLASDIRWWRLPAGDDAPRAIPRAGSGNRPGVAAFGPGLQMVACAFDNNLVHLLNSHDGHTLAELQTPGHSVISRLCFSPDGGRLAVATENHALHVWDLAAIRGQLDGLALNWGPAVEAAAPLGPAARHAVFRWDEPPRTEPGWAAWRDLRERFATSSDFQGRGYELAGTCFRRGLALEAQGQLDQALAEYHSACLLDPTAQHLSARGWVYQRLGRQQEAAADWAASLDPDSREFWDLYRRAILRLHLGDEAGYRRDCLDLLGRYAADATAGMAEQLAKLCLLTPAGVGDREQVLQLAQRAVEHDPEFRWYQAVRGLAETRFGDPETAIELLQQVVQSERGRHPVIDSLLQLALTLNYRHLDRDHEAEAAFEQANQLLEQLRGYGSGEAATLAWHDWLVTQILHREALRN